MMLQIIETTIRSGLLLILVWTPLALGSVHARAYALMEVHIFLLVAAWMLHVIVARPRLVPGSRFPPVFVRTPFTLPLILFLGLLMFQLIPLPPGALTRLSPSTSELYSLFLPGWPTTHAPLSLHPYATRLALFKFLAYASLFFLMINTLLTHRGIRSVYWVIIGTASLMALIGIGQKLSGTSSIYWFRDTSYVANFFGPYINGNHFAGYQAMAIPLGLGLLLTQPTNTNDDAPYTWRHRLLRWFGLLSPARTLLVYALAVMTGAVCLSLSRGGVLSLLLGLMLFGLLLRTRCKGAGHRVVLAITLTAMGGMVGWLGIAPLLTRFDRIASGAEALGWAGRLPVFQATWRMTQDFPLFGVGYEAFPVIFPRYQPTAATHLRFLYTHNDFLQLLTETGWVGFILLVGGALLLVTDILRRWRSRHDPFVQVMVPAGLAALGAMAVHSLVDFNLHIPANALLFTAILALTCACSNLPRGRSGGMGRKVADSRRLGRLCSALLPWLSIPAALWLASEALPVAIADLLYPQEQVLRPSHWVYRVDPAVHRQRLHQALRWTPDNPWYWRNLAHLEAQAAQQTLQVGGITEDMRQHAATGLQQAAASYQRALHQSPTDPYMQLARLYVLHNLSTLHASSVPGGIETLSTRFARLATLAPSHPDIQYGLAVLLLIQDPGDATHAASLPFFRQALHLDTSYAKQVLQAYRRYLPEAEALHRLALTIPHTSQGHFRAAQLLQHSHWWQARLHYRSALILEKSDPAILQAYATALQRHREFATAREMWERLRQVNPHDATAYLGLADAYRSLDDQAGVLQILQQLVTRFPRQVEYRSRLARLHESKGESTKALQEYQRLATLRPDDPNVFYQLGEYWRRQGEHLRAIAYYRRAVQLKPDHAGFRQALEKALER